MTSSKKKEEEEGGWPDWLPKMEMPILPTLSSPSQTAANLRDLLVMAESAGVEMDADMRQLADTMIDELAGARVACPPELLGSSSSVDDGLWRAVYTQGATPRWQANANVLKGLMQNRAGQAYDASARRVTNYGEIVGSAVHFTAEGTFKAVDDSTRCPKDFEVSIEQGGLVLFGLRLLSGAISGPGYLRVLYADDNIRIFESPTDSPEKWEQAGLKVVQVRESYFC